jgi:hypothetical protein
MNKTAPSASELAGLFSAEVVSDEDVLVPMGTPRKFKDDSVVPITIRRQLTDLYARIDDGNMTLAGMYYVESMLLGILNSLEDQIELRKEALSTTIQRGKHEARL